jgi:hypothetical protein
MNKKTIALKILKSRRTRRIISRGLKNRQVRNVVFKQLSRRLRFR